MAKKIIPVLLAGAMVSGSALAYGLEDAIQDTGLPGNLIRAIALEESRRLNAETNQVQPWPWTLHAENRALFFSSRREAESALRQLRYRGVTNIDVGAFQVNIRWNGHLTERPEDLLDPAVNIWAFSQVIRECQSRMKRVREVISCYHTGQPSSERGRRYADRVITRWKDLENGSW
jgi:hypothetical protein